MKWKINLLMILLMAWIIPVMWSESKKNQPENLIVNSIEEKKRSEEIYWTDSEVKELVEELKKVKDDAVDKAVKFAVIPLYDKIEKLEIQVNENIGTVIFVGVICFISGYFIHSITSPYIGG